MVDRDRRLEVMRTPVLVVEYRRGESEPGHTAPHVVEIHTLNVPPMPLIPPSIELPGFFGPLVPVVTVFKSSIEAHAGIDIGVTHGTTLDEVGLEQLQIEPPIGYSDTERSSVVGVNQHDLSGDAEHADFPDDLDDGEDRNNEIFRDPRFASHVVSPRSFGHPTSDWRPKNS